MNSKNGNEFNFDLYFVLGSVSHFTSLMLVDFQSTPKTIIQSSLQDLCVNDQLVQIISLLLIRML